MDVVSPELNSLLPDEIMDTEAIEEVPHSQSEPMHDTPVPMETDAPVTSESLNICSNAAPAEHVQAVTTASSVTISASSTLFTIKPALATSTAATKTTDSLTGTTVSTSGTQKLATPFAFSAANHQIILSKVASAQATEAAKAAAAPAQVIKQEGQKLLVTAIGKSGQSIVLQLPQTGSKPGVLQTSGDAKSQTPQFKVVTIDGRELKPVVGSAGNQVTTLQAHQLKTMQIPKKTPASSTAPIKFIITKTVNSKGLSPQTSVTPVIAGRVVTQTSPVMSPKTITLSEPHNTTIQSVPGKKIAISPLKTPSKVSCWGISTLVLFVFVSAAETTSRPRKPCNCTKSQCLKLYCDCFANGEFCNNCNCNNCFNNLEHETERLKAIKTCLDRNPEAFKPKIGKGKEGESDRRHSKGCNCKRSGCLKNYCECYEAKIMCSSICKCIGCKNFEESPERKTLMHLADAAEVRVQQQTAAKTKLSSQISDLLMRTTPIISSGGGRLPYTFVTKEVLEATCECLLEQAKRAEQTRQPQAEAERVILEEFGHCLMSIISSAGKAKTDCASINC
uniref:Lin-54 DREAM MuvB core complex component n=1 Tax=Xiphophorus couchianus TaxID=32473 RepID=A0A3B5MR03_9TELE